MAGSPLLRGVSFKLERRDRMTLSGRNGSGKTTLLRMLAGRGHGRPRQLTLQKGARVSLHDQRPPRERGLTLRDYVLSGARRWSRSRRELARLEQAMADGAHDDATLAAYVARRRSGSSCTAATAGATARWSTMRGLGFTGDDLDRQLSTFSGGELTRGSLARALTGEPDLLLLDEPTNHLDIASLEWLEQHLPALDAAIVLVAHDRWFLEAVGTSVLELEAGRSRFFAGPWHAWRKEQAARELALGRAIDSQQAEIARLERFVERFRAKASKARQAQSRVKRLEKMERVRARPARRPATCRSRSRRPSARAGWCSSSRAARIEVPGTMLLEDASTVGRARRARDAGGRQRLREDHPDRDPRGPPTSWPRASCAPATTWTWATSPSTPRSWAARAPCSRRPSAPPGSRPARRARCWGGSCSPGTEVEKPVGGLSGGELRRLSLAVLVNSGANMLVLDEPTNHLDLESREALEDALTSFAGSLLLVSHDRALLDAVGIAHVRGRGRHAAQLRGRLGRVRAGARERDEAERGGASPPPRRGTKCAEGARRQAGEQGPSKNAQRAQRELEREIEEAEAALQRARGRAGRSLGVGRPGARRRVERAPRTGQAPSGRPVRTLGSSR